MIPDVMEMVDSDVDKPAKGDIEMGAAATSSTSGGGTSSMHYHNNAGTGGGNDDDTGCCCVYLDEAKDAPNGAWCCTCEPLHYAEAADWCYNHFKCCNCWSPLPVVLCFCAFHSGPSAYWARSFWCTVLPLFILLFILSLVIEVIFWVLVLVVGLIVGVLLLVFSILWLPCLGIMLLAKTQG